MFSGIVETTAKVLALEKEGSNLNITMSCPFAGELGVDQSVAHNGVCLTVTSHNDSNYTVTAIKETLDRSNLGLLKGHVDTTGECVSKTWADGSWVFTFKYGVTPELALKGYVTVEKGSVAVNGTSLTVCNSQKDQFSVCIIPYTYDHTNFHCIEVGSKVNLEFDIIGKYLSRMMEFKND